MRDDVLLAFSILRRTVTLCRFRGVSLEFAQKRELPTSLSGAEKSVQGFVAESLTHFRPARVAVEIRPGVSPRRDRLTELVTTSALAAGVPCWRVSESELLAAYGEPPLRTRAELRRMAWSLWPVLSYYLALAPGSLDAAVLGQHVQVSTELQSAETEGSLDAVA